MHYRLCLRHMGKQDNCFLFWSNNSSGYTRDLSKADLEETLGSKDDPIIAQKLADKFKQKVVLPQYSEHKEAYAGNNEFYVLPNTGQVRQTLGITELDIHLDGDRNSFKFYFKDTVRELFKWSYSKTSYRVHAKQHVAEFWYMDSVFTAVNRNQAIFQAFNYWLPCGYDNYIDFKSDVLCNRDKTQVLDRWVTAN